MANSILYGSSPVLNIVGNGTSFSRWAYGQPDNGKAADGYETCGLLNTTFTQYAYADAKCSLSTYRYICDMGKKF